MVRRHISKEAGCLRCGYDTKSVNYVLFQCPFARLVWALSPIHAPPDGLFMNSLYSNSYEVRYYPTGGNKAADRIAKETFTFLSNVLKLYYVVPFWLEYQVGHGKIMVENHI
ncbi:unnamed protein product [Brassica rapa]|uniref:Reverse transcriptase zinc-binding domain-containing protein n=1 Tax=Brassica campestris TaxID=3711 RepID=A0A3P5ZUB1_BRACM|nr:unnamed protein product [Brassica rapa]VDC76111.1 unnamed protein product [Brassica rapa]